MTIEANEIYAAATVISLTLLSAVLWYIIRHAE